MRRTRTWIAWCLLLLATTIAVPRTWIHHCGQGSELHVELDHSEHPDQIEHETCAVCDFAGTAGLQSATQILLLAGNWVTIEMVKPQILLESAPLSIVALRGPPVA